MRPPVRAVAIALLLVLAGCAAPSHPQSIPDRSEPGDGTNGTPATDPASDVVGWENGYWYNESLSIDADDGLNESELNAVVNRSMARVEYIRDVEFDRRVPVNVVSRTAFRERVGNNSRNSAPDPARVALENVTYEALFLVGENRSASSSRANNTATNVQGFYAPARDEITIVSATETPSISETTLGHELVHAFQWGTYELRGLGGPPIEASNVRNAVIEGEAGYVDGRYGDFCDVEWGCVSPTASTGGNASLGDFHVGLYLLQYFPYSDGPGFIDRIRTRGGWDAVADIYEDPPASTEQVIDPREYPGDGPTEVEIPDRSSERWNRVTPDRGVGYETVGQPGITAMLAYPSYDDRRQGGVLSPQMFLNFENGSVNASDPVNYDVPPSDGWDGDTLRAYVDGSGQTGYVWKLAWDTEAEAREFAEAYRGLLQYWGAESRDGGVWRIPDGESQFADAFALRVEGSTVTIVNAPSVRALSGVHSPVSSWG